MNTDEIYPSEYLDPVTLVGKTFTTIITGVRQETVEAPWGTSECLIVDLYEAKGLIVNKTNRSAITNKVGSGDPEKWIGTVITMTANFIKVRGMLKASTQVRPGPEKPLLFLDEAESKEEVAKRHKLLGKKSNTAHAQKLINKWKSTQNN